jgi:hypothetical protein
MKTTYAAKSSLRMRYEWLFFSLSTLSLGLCAEWLLHLGGATWHW